MAVDVGKAIHGGIGLILAIVWGMYLFEFLDFGCLGAILLLGISLIFIIYILRRPPQRSTEAEEAIGETASISTGRGGLT